ncbi:hypothetical protein V8Z69_18265 [Microbacterium aurugineum]|nr:MULTISPECIES: hypothetical protein [unclassified Microbacterium]KRD52159.1 hypothetical protein ASE34_09745 [Microbacterium sp. Root280D1]CAH0192352.1 hypothetical protein SRABI98_01791 [Microbacterium sp. Bi98]
MVLIYSTTPHDTGELVALRQVINDNERAFSDLRTIYSVDQRRLCDEYDALMAAQRPTYPTPEHLKGLDMVAEMMRAGTEYGDHRGSPRQVDREAGRALPRSVDFSSFACRINIRAFAQYRARSSQHAWIFTEDDIEAFRHELTKRSLGIASHWQHEDGVAFQVFNARD